MSDSGGSKTGKDYLTENNISFKPVFDGIDDDIMKNINSSNRGNGDPLLVIDAGKYNILNKPCEGAQGISKALDLGNVGGELLSETTGTNIDKLNYAGNNGAGGGAGGESGSSSTINALSNSASSSGGTSPNNIANTPVQSITEEESGPKVKVGTPRKH